MKRRKQPTHDPYKDWFLVFLSDMTRTRKLPVRVYDGMPRKAIPRNLAQLAEAMGV